MTAIPFRLVSLLELLEHNAEAYCRLSSILGQALLLLRQGTANEDTLRGLAGSLGELQREVLKLEMGSVNKQIERIKHEWLDLGNWPTDRQIEELYNRLRDALEERLFLAVPLSVSAMYQQKDSVFGQSVEDVFPRSVEDISEAGKCLSLGRSTAVVFHLMRATEAAVGRLSVKLQIANPDREWGKLLSDIAAKIEAMPKGNERNRWSESHTHLYHVKQAWRNDTMHPKQTYTPEEAKAIFEAVKVFMRHLTTLVSTAP